MPSAASTFPTWRVPDCRCRVVRPARRSLCLPGHAVNMEHESISASRFNAEASRFVLELSHITLTSLSTKHIVCSAVRLGLINPHCAGGAAGYKSGCFPVIGSSRRPSRAPSTQHFEWRCPRPIDQSALHSIRLQIAALCLDKSTTHIGGVLT